MKHSRNSYKIEPIPRMRRFVFDAGHLGRRRHTIHGLIEVDVTTARQWLRTYAKNTGQSLSLTAYVIYCLGKALKNNEHLYAYRDWRNRLIIFDQVNIIAMIEVDTASSKVPMPHVFKAVNTRSFIDLNDEMRTTQREPRVTTESKFMELISYLPGFLRRSIFLLFIKFPLLVPEYTSAVMVTAVGMFGKGGGWGIPMANYTLLVTVGGMVKKPGVIDEQIAIREYLDLTLSIDHDIVDGAPAARFVETFRELLESGYGLEL